MKVRPTVKEAHRPRQKNVGLLGWLGQRVGLTDSKFWSGFFGTSTWAGQQVTATGAMQLSAVNRAVRLTSETQAAMPLGFYTDDGSGPKVQRGSQTDSLLRISPNGEQTPMEFLEQVLGCRELVGDGLARKHKIGQRITALTVMDPTRCHVVRNVMGGLEYRYHDDKGRLQILSTDDVWHLRGFSLGGDRGWSTVRYGAQSMAMAIAAGKTAGGLFSTGLRNSGFLNTGQVLDEPDRARLKKIMEDYMGAENAGGMMILEGGMEFKPLNMSAQDAELLLTRKFEIEEIGRWFGIPPILLGHAVEGQTMWGSGVDSIIQAWLTLGLGQRLVRNQQQIFKGLEDRDERAAGLYAKFNADSLLAVNSTARMQVLSTAVQNSLMKPNEARAKMELGAEPGGDELLAQVNLVPLRLLGQSSAPDAQARAALRSWLGIEDQSRAAPEPPSVH